LNFCDREVEIADQLSQTYNACKDSDRLSRIVVWSEKLPMSHGEALVRSDVRHVQCSSLTLLERNKSPLEGQAGET
jgi:hypothetical protein